MLGSQSRVPGLEKGQQGLRGRAVQTGEQLLVEGLAGRKAVQCPIWVPFAVHAKDIAGIVTKKIGGDAYGALDRRG